MPACSTAPKGRCPRWGGTCQEQCADGESEVAICPGPLGCRCCVPTCLQAGGFCVDHRRKCRHGKVTRNGCSIKNRLCCIYRGKLIKNRVLVPPHFVMIRYSSLLWTAIVASLINFVLARSNGTYCTLSVNLSFWWWTMFTVTQAKIGSQIPPASQWWHLNYLLHVLQQ